MDGATNAGAGEDCFRVAGDVTGDGRINENDANYIFNASIGEGDRVNQNQIARNPDDIIIYSIAQEEREKKIAEINAMIVGFPDTYTLRFSSQYNCYQTIVTANTLTLEELTGYFTGKTVKIYDADNVLATSGYVANGYTLVINDLLCIRFRVN